MSSVGYEQVNKDEIERKTAKFRFTSDEAVPSELNELLQSVQDDYYHKDTIFVFLRNKLWVIEETLNGTLHTSDIV